MSRLVGWAVFILIIIWIAHNPAQADLIAHNIAGFFTGLVS